MKIFKNIDDKLFDVGFVKVKDDKYCVIYERKKEHNFTQVLTIIHKRNGNHLLQSYDKNLFDEKKIGNCCVGLTYYETKLIMKKFKQKLKKWN